ncbi:ferritin-like domain-containing protein [Calycina marina]|uniref:Ferritin-like domain-containing protein n=1 Tax=Calycina marina TaxID=1763456 RepID=A0A9P8CFJ9_9HELO|nr:ferritin-like domain-containing protein [Calycina marina]
MPSIKQIIGAVALGFATASSALPLAARQNPTTGLPDGLTDVDVLQFALTLEFLESAFYQQGFAKFADSDFAALGLDEEDLTNLKGVGATEDLHVDLLLSAIAATGQQPVAPCTYDFKFTDAAGMVATAAILEQVGVSAYLGAAPILASPDILTTAAEILTVEARHQTFIRTASKAIAVPSAFDTPLGIRSVFTLAAGFITACPAGSNLAITPFSEVTMADTQATVVSGSTLQLTTTATGATFCGFTNGGQTGGTAFTAFANGACVAPSNLAGAVYVHLTNAAPATGVLTDAIVVAGPMVVVVS